MHYFDLATILSFVIGSVLPIVVGRVTKVTTHPAIKGAALLGLSVLTGVLSQWLDAANSHTVFAWQPVVLSAVGAFVTGVAAHTAILQHTPLSSTGTPFGQARPTVAGLQDLALVSQQDINTPVSYPDPPPAVVPPANPA